MQNKVVNMTPSIHHLAKMRDKIIKKIEYSRNVYHTAFVMKLDMQRLCFVHTRKTGF